MATAIGYACAYTQVLEVLKYTKRDLVNKIPKYKITMYQCLRDPDYKFKINVNKPIGEQNLSTEAKAIIGNLFKNYIATEDQRNKIEAKEKFDMEQLEKEKRELYSVDGLFKGNKQVVQGIKEETYASNNIKDNSTSIMNYKESFITRFINKIKSFFK